MAAEVLVAHDAVAVEVEHDSLNSLNSKEAAEVLVAHDAVAVEVELADHLLTTY